MITQPEGFRAEIERSIKVFQTLTGTCRAGGQAKMRLDHNTPGDSLRCRVIGRGKSVRCQPQSARRISAAKGCYCTLHTLCRTMPLLLRTLPRSLFSPSMFSGHESPHFTGRHGSLRAPFHCLYPYLSPPS